MSFTIPDRPEGSLTGSAFVATLPPSPGAEREEAIVQELLTGNVPDFLRAPATVTVQALGHLAKFSVLPDYLCVGSDEDFVRVPLYPGNAQRVADAFGASLPTRRLVAQAWTQAVVKVAPKPMTERRESTQCFRDHNALIELQRNGRSGLIAGHKKDIVLTPQLIGKPYGLAIYGWQGTDGTPIQGLNAVSHNKWYVDYSHGVRLVAADVLVDGERLNITTLLDGELCLLVSNEGPSKFFRYSPQ